MTSTRSPKWPFKTLTLTVIVLICGVCAVLVHFDYSIANALFLAWLSTGLLVPALYLVRMKLGPVHRESPVVGDSRAGRASHNIANTPGQ